MYCYRCGEVIPENSSTCNYCGATQPKKQAPPPVQRPVQPPQQKAGMPTSYYVDSWILFGLCMVYGLFWIAVGISGGASVRLYKGIIACCAACIFIPQIKVINHATGTLLIKLAIAIGVIILI